MWPSPQKGVLVMYCSLEKKASSITAMPRSKTCVSGQYGRGRNHNTDRWGHPRKRLHGLGGRWSQVESANTGVCQEDTKKDTKGHKRMDEENKINSIFILQWNNEQHNADLQLHLKVVWAVLVISGIMLGNRVSPRENVPVKMQCA